jgi:rhodanese-related sulfurtransferase
LTEEALGKEQEKTMKYGNLGLILFGLAPLVFGAPQKHPSIAPGAKETSARFLHSLQVSDTKTIVIDVRTPEEYSKGHIPEAINIPITELPQRIRNMHVPKGTTIVTMCDHGGRSSRAALELEKMGYRTASFCRIDSWKKDGYQIKKGKSHTGPESRLRGFGSLQGSFERVAS